MNIYRLEDRSVYFFVKDVVFSGYTMNVVDSFPQDTNLTIPTIAVDSAKVKEEPYELGNRDKLRTRNWYIDIFARNKQQADDLGYMILENTKNGINVYDYNVGFPPTVTPPRIEHMEILADSYEPIPVMLDEVESKYFRGQVILVTQNDTV